MTLYEDQVARMGLGRGAPEMVESDFVQRGGGGIARQMSAVLGGDAVGLHDHRHRVPTDVSLDAALEGAIAGILRLAAGGDAVDVCSVGPEGQVSAAPARVVDEPVQDEVRTRGPM